MSHTTSKLYLSYLEFIDLALGNNGPCKECLVRATCRKSFIDNSACKKLANAMEKFLEENGKSLEENGKLSINGTVHKWVKKKIKENK